MNEDSEMEYFQDQQDFPVDPEYKILLAKGTSNSVPRPIYLLPQSEETICQLATFEEI